MNNSRVYPHNWYTGDKVKCIFSMAWYGAACGQEGKTQKEKEKAFSISFNVPVFEVIHVFDQGNLAHKTRALAKEKLCSKKWIREWFIKWKKLPFWIVYLIFYRESICMNCLFYLALLTESVSLHYFQIHFEMLIWHFVAFFPTLSVKRKMRWLNLS